jgi:hypothetical protein
MFLRRVIITDREMFFSGRICEANKMNEIMEGNSLYFALYFVNWLILMFYFAFGTSPSIPNAQMESDLHKLGLLVGSILRVKFFWEFCQVIWIN